MSEPQETRKPNRFRITSIIIAIAMLSGAFGLLIGSFTVNVSATITGDTYSGSGNWVITQDTEYSGTNVHVYGNIYINTGSLTIRHATLIMDESSQYQYNIYVNWSYQTDRAFKMKYAYLDVSNSSDDGIPMLKILPVPSCNVYISNSSVNHTSIQTDIGNQVWLDNSTFHSSRFMGTSMPGGSLNISGCIFKDYTGYNLIGASSDGSIITENTFTNITQTPDPSYSYNGMISVNGGYGASEWLGNITITKNHFDKIEIGGISVLRAWSVRISDNVFDNLTSTALGGAIGIMVQGEGKHSGLTQWSYVENNTFKYCAGDIRYGGTFAIMCTYVAAYVTENPEHWYIQNNDIWNVRKLSNLTDNGDGSVGIYINQGVDIYVLNNDIGNVSSSVGPYGESSGGQCNGIAVFGQGSMNGPFTAHEVYIRHNTIGLVANSSVGIQVTWMSQYIEISNNTIGPVEGYDSSGIGIYNQPRNILIADNTMSLWRDVWGINLAHNHTYATVVRNTLHVLAQAHFFDNGIWSFGRGGGAIAINDEMDAVYAPGELHWTAVGDLLIDNTITQESYSEFFPEYTILNCSHQITIGAPGDWPKIVLNQDAKQMIYSWHSNFSVRGPADELPIMTRTGASAAVTVSGNEWYADFRDTEAFYFTNVSLTPLGAASDDDVNITVDIWDPLTIGSPILRFIGEASAGSIVIFTLSGLESGVYYNVYVDGNRIEQIRCDSGSITFSYSGPWSEHTFEVEMYDPWGPLYDMGPWMLSIGVIVGLTAIMLVAVGSRLKRR